MTDELEIQGDQLLAEAGALRPGTGIYREADLIAALAAGRQRAGRR